MYNRPLSDVAPVMEDRGMPKSIPQLARETGDHLKLSIEKTNEVIKIMYGEDSQPQDGNTPESLDDTMKLNLGLSITLFNMIDMILARLCN